MKFDTSETWVSGLGFRYFEYHHLVPEMTLLIESILPGRSTKNLRHFIVIAKDPHDGDGSLQGPHCQRLIYFIDLIIELNIFYIAIKGHLILIKLTLIIINTPLFLKSINVLANPLGPGRNIPIQSTSYHLLMSMFSSCYIYY